MINIKFITLIMTFTLLLGCSSVKHTPLDDLTAYKNKAHWLIARAQDPLSKADEMEKEGLLLINLARPIIESYIVRNKQCRVFLDFILSRAETMTKLGLDEIEKNYHQGDSLPATKDECYEAKELVVHPATVVVLARKKFTAAGRVQIEDELDEVLAHLDLLR